MAIARSPKIGKPKTRNGTDWIVPAPLVDKLIPGDQLAWCRVALKSETRRVFRLLLPLNMR